MIDKNTFPSFHDALVLELKLNYSEGRTPNLNSVELIVSAVLFEEYEEFAIVMRDPSLLTGNGLLSQNVIFDIDFLKGDKLSFQDIVEASKSESMGVLPKGTIEKLFESSQKYSDILIRLNPSVGLTLNVLCKSVAIFQGQQLLGDSNENWKG